MLTGSYGLFTHPAQRTYNVNSDQGTITVINEVGPTASFGVFGQVSTTPAYTESYTLDTRNEALLNYQENFSA